MNGYRPTALALLFAVLVSLPTPGCQGNPSTKYPKFTAPVVDLAEVVEPGDEERMNRFVQVLQERTGAQVAVVTLATLSGEEPSMYATELAEHWGVGDKEKDNGVLVLVVPGERKYFTATGRGVEGALPDSMVGSLQRAFLVPAFKEGAYGAGLRRYLYELGIRIAAEGAAEPGALSGDFGAILGVQGDGKITPIPAGKTKKRARRKQSWVNWVFLLILFGFIFGGGARSRRRRGDAFLAGLFLGGFGGGHHRGGGFGGGFGGGGAGGSW